MKHILSSPIAKIVIGLLVGIGLLFIVSRFVNILATLSAVQQNLLTPRGIVLALLSGVAFLLAFSLRGIRWSLFLKPISNVTTATAVRLFLVSIFINFLLPVSGGEIAKALMLKRIAKLPVSRSLPTIAIDRSLDLLPALVIMGVVPLLGIEMDIKLWLVLSIIVGLLLIMVSFIGLTIWKRTTAIHLLHHTIKLLPGSIGGKIEGFATSFVDSLISAASRPRVFLVALGLTCLAVICDSIFAMLTFWTIGFPISFRMAIFGYTIFNMFYIFPTPPGQLGSNEAVGLLVFSGLLHLPVDKVTAMFFFSHPWAALIMCATGLICLKTLGLTISHTMKARYTQSHEEETEETEEIDIEGQKIPANLV